MGKFKHGFAKRNKATKEYKAWRAAISRCYNPNANRYETYGARGIRVCREWRRDFLRFLTDMGTCPDGYSLDRIDNDGNYSPGNCRWIPRNQQSRNQTRNRRITLNGRTMILADWAREFGISGILIHKRIKDLGWSIKDAVTRHVRAATPTPEDDWRVER